MLPPLINSAHGSHNKIKVTCLLLDLSGRPSTQHSLGKGRSRDTDLWEMEVLKVKYQGSAQS